MIGRPPISTLFPSPPLSRSPRPRLDRSSVVPQSSVHVAQIGHRHPDRVETGVTIGAEGEVLFERSVGMERSEEHTSELQSPCNLVCRLLLEKKKTTEHTTHT